MQEIQAQTQAKLAEIQADAQAKAQLMQLEYELKQQLENAKGMTSQMMRQEDMQFRANLEKEKDDRKDDRVKKQAVEQSKMISQRQGKRGELANEEDSLLDTLTS